MSTDLHHDRDRANEDRHSQNWREYLEQERARAKSRGWLKHRQHMIRMEGTIFITAAEMAEILGISKSYAYKMIKQMSEDFEANGFITISGKVSKKYFEEKFYGVETA